MADPTTRFQLNTLRSRLQAVQYLFANEARLHELIGKVLESAGFEFDREHRIDEKNRADFWLSGIVIEVKVAGDLAAAWRQCLRYSKLPGVSGVLLASTCPWARDRLINEKWRDRFAIAYLRRSAL